MFDDNGQPIFNAVQVFLAQAADEGQLDLTPSANCRVCRDELIRALVNKMLARMLTLSDVLDVLEPHNLTLKAQKRITYNSLRRHRAEHFPRQVPQAAVLRKLAERRAAEQGRNIETATGTLANAVSYLETVMIRGLEQATDPNVIVSMESGMKAAIKLHEIQRKDEGLLERAELLAKMNRVIELVRTYVPQESWPALQAALSGDATAVEASTLAPTVAKAVRMVEIDDSPDEEVER